MEYVTMPGWQTSIAHMKSLEELPPKAKAYVDKLAELTGLKSESRLFADFRRFEREPFFLRALGTYLGILCIHLCPPNILIYRLGHL